MFHSTDLSSQWIFAPLPTPSRVHKGSDHLSGTQQEQDASCLKLSHQNTVFPQGQRRDVSFAGCFYTILLLQQHGLLMCVRHNHATNNCQHCAPPCRLNRSSLHRTESLPVQKNAHPMQFRWRSEILRQLIVLPRWKLFSCVSTCLCEGCRVICCTFAVAEMCTISCHTDSAAVFFSVSFCTVWVEEGDVCCYRQGMPCQPELITAH